MNMKPAIVLPVLLLFLGLSFTGCATTSLSNREKINTLNYNIDRQVLQPNATSTGVVLQVSPVTVRAMTANLIVGLPEAIVDGFVGTDYSTEKLQANEYVVRLDGMRGQPNQIISVVQGPECKVSKGDRVFIITTQTYAYNAGNYGYGNGYALDYEVRLTPYRDLRTYSEPGVSEMYDYMHPTPQSRQETAGLPPASAAEQP